MVTRVWPTVGCESKDDVRDECCYRGVCRGRGESSSSHSIAALGWRPGSRSGPFGSSSSSPYPFDCVWSLVLSFLINPIGALLCHSAANKNGQEHGRILNRILQMDFSDREQAIMTRNQPSEPAEPSSEVLFRLSVVASTCIEVPCVLHKAGLNDPRDVSAPAGDPQWLGGVGRVKSSRFVMTRLTCISNPRRLLASHTAVSATQITCCTQQLLEDHGILEVLAGHEMGGNHEAWCKQTRTQGFVCLAGWLFY
jgi:hypothetical protein